MVLKSNTTALICSSIHYAPIRVGVGNPCTEKATRDGSIGAMHLLLDHNVDVIFGPMCSPGTYITVVL